LSKIDQFPGFDARQRGKQKPGKNGNFQKCQHVFFNVFNFFIKPFENGRKYMKTSWNSMINVPSPRHLHVFSKSENG